jgi:serine protease Do
VVRGSIGISFREGLSGAVGRVYGFKNGVLVQEVTPGGPSDKAGLKPRDVIVTIDGRPVKDGNDLVSDIAGRRPGTQARIGYIRDGKEAETSVTIGDRDKVFADQAQGNADEAPQPGQSSENKLGMAVREVTPATAEKIGSGGVVVTAVKPGSFADQQGLQPGLVITRINRQSTASKSQFDTVVNGLKSGQDVVFEVVDPKHPERGINFLGGTLP